MLAQPSRRRSGFMNFDLTRLTPVGWLVFLFSFALTFAAVIYLANQWDTMFPPPANVAPRQAAKGNPGIWVGIGVGIGSFFALMGLLRLIGVKLVRPKPEEPERRPRRRSESRGEERSADRPESRSADERSARPRADDPPST